MVNSVSFDLSALIVACPEGKEQILFWYPTSVCNLGGDIQALKEIFNGLCTISVQCFIVIIWTIW